MRYALGDLKREDVLSELEALTTIWRGDETEIGALEIIARLYTDEGRYRDLFYVMRNAVAAHPDFDMTRRIQDQAAATFESLFLAGKGDGLSAIDALALFYDFRELTPIGRRGDEIIRRLADRLVAVDLLDQASDLLQYQVDRRLQGAARAQVATRLAVIYLMNRKPDRALATCAPLMHPISPTNSVISGCLWRRALCPISGAMMSRSKSLPMSKVARPFACAPISSGRRTVGRPPPNKSSFTTASTGTSGSL